jgi:O-antigen/teichoic acid export membrane protein
MERQGESLDEPYKRATSFMTVLVWPGYGFLFLMMFPIVRILYGSQWDAAVPVAQALCIWGCFSALTAFSSDLLLARGGVRKVFLLNLIECGVRIVLIIVSVPYGLFVVSIAFGFAGLLHLFVASYMVRTLSGVTVFDLSRSSLKSFGVTCYALAIPITIAVFMDVDTDDYLLPFILALVGLVGGWMVGVFCTGHEAGDEVRRLHSSIWVWVRSR